jgi:hypothetical protein
MKDLICVFTYCPDFERKKVLLDLLNQLQPIRDEYEILVLSHSSLPEICSDLSDFIFIDSENFLIENFGLRNKFWFRAEKVVVESSLVYPPSTHYAIYSLIHFAINFTKYRNINKIHCIEYDINLPNIDLLSLVSNKLNDYDNVMFRSEDNWCYGTYFAFKTKNLPIEYYEHSRDYILNSISDIPTRMTENFTPKFLGVNDRSTYYEKLEVLDPIGIYQKIDNHRNDELNWCVPVCDTNNDMVYFFIFNEKGGEWEVDVLFNDEHKNFKPLKDGFWILEPICKISELKNLIVMVNKKIKYEFFLNEKNLDDFINNNLVKFK